MGSSGRTSKKSYAESRTLGVLTITVSRIVEPILRIAAWLRSPEARHRASTQTQGLTEGKSALIYSTSTTTLFSQAESQHTLEDSIANCNDDVTP